MAKNGFQLHYLGSLQVGIIHFSKCSWDILVLSNFIKVGRISENNSFLDLAISRVINAENKVQHPVSLHVLDFGVRLYCRNSGKQVVFYPYPKVKACFYHKNLIIMTFFCTFPIRFQLVGWAVWIQDSYLSLVQKMMFVLWQKSSFVMFLSQTTWQWLNILLQAWHPDLTEPWAQLRLFFKRKMWFQQNFIPEDQCMNQSYFSSRK